jgi:hypothetical protein
MRVVAFKQTPIEPEKFCRYGEVIEIDGTHAPLKTNSELVPITVMNRGRHIHSGGMMFAAYLTADVIGWLLNVLVEQCRF